MSLNVLLFLTWLGSCRNPRDHYGVQYFFTRFFLVFCCVLCLVNYSTKPSPLVVRLQFYVKSPLVQQIVIFGSLVSFLPNLWVLYRIQSMVFFSPFCSCFALTSTIILVHVLCCCYCWEWYTYISVFFFFFCLTNLCLETTDLPWFTGHDL